MRVHRGFTLLEMLTVVAIVGVVAALAVPKLIAARRNASVASTIFELRLWLDGLKVRAVRDQQDVVAIVMDVPQNDPNACADGADALCGGYYLVRAPPGFQLNGFDPGKMNLSNAAHLQDYQLPRGLRFHLRAAGRNAVPPYANVLIFDGGLLATCANARQCVGVRFRSDGEVEPIWPTGVPGNPRAGLAFAIGSELTQTTPSDLDARRHAGAEQQGLVVTFPTGLVKTFGVAP